jgi:hypothetical protein
MHGDSSLIGLVLLTLALDFFLLSVAGIQLHEKTADALICQQE